MVMPMIRTCRIGFLALFVVALVGCGESRLRGEQRESARRQCLLALRQIDELQNLAAQKERALAVAYSYNSPTSEIARVALDDLRDLYGQRLMGSDGPLAIHYGNGMILVFVVVGGKCKYIVVAQGVP
jgi:hypothetical protein